MIRIVRSDNTEFKFNEIFKITEMSGFGTITSENATQQRAYGNGDIVTGKRTPSRIIDIDSKCRSTTLNKTGRELARRFFNPNYDFKLYVNYSGTEYWVPCIIDTVNLPTVNIHEKQQLSLSLYCKDPYFLSVDEFGKNIAEIEPKFGYPWVSTAESGFVYGLFNFASKVFIDNDGDVETFCRAVIDIKGNVSTFSLIKNEKEYVQINGDFVKGDELVIDFVNNKVTLNGEIINRQIDRKSTFFAIDIGGTDIQYSASVGSNVIEVFIFYNKKYTGV